MAGEEAWTRDDSWSRPKGYVGMRHPASERGDSGWERWPRFCAEIAPELAAELDDVRKQTSREHHGTRFTRADQVRSALRLYLNTKRPEPAEAIEGEAVEILDVDLPALGEGADR